jgi:Flp pilus assembly protein TadD
VLEREPDNRSALLNLAILEARRGRIPLARQRLERILRLEPQDARARALLARLDAGGGEAP